MLAEDEAKKAAKEEEKARIEAETAALNNGKLAIEAAQKEFDAQKALEEENAKLEAELEK